MSSEHTEIIANFCSRFEGREQEVGCKLIVYGDIQMIADEMNIPIKEVADALLSELNHSEE